MNAMEQASFADLDYQCKKRKTRREIFLERMDGLIPWEELEERIRPHYPKAGRGRRPYELSAMLRIHCVQLFYNLSDPGMEDMLYEVESVRRFVGLRLSGALPDETTILNFRHLLEEHGLSVGLFKDINRHLASRGARRMPRTIPTSTPTAPATPVDILPTGSPPLSLLLFCLSGPRSFSVRCRLPYQPEAWLASLAEANDQLCLATEAVHQSAAHRQKRRAVARSKDHVIVLRMGYCQRSRLNLLQARHALTHTRA